MKLPTNYHKDGYLSVDVLFVKKIRLFVLSSMEEQCMHLELLFSKTYYIPTKYTPIDHSVTKIQECIHHFGRCFQEHERMDTW